MFVAAFASVGATKVRKQVGKVETRAEKFRLAFLLCFVAISERSAALNYILSLLLNCLFASIFGTWCRRGLCTCRKCPVYYLLCFLLLCFCSAWKQERCMCLHFENVCSKSSKGIYSEKLVNGFIHTITCCTWLLVLLFSLQIYAQSNLRKVDYKNKLFI